MTNLSKRTLDSIARRKRIESGLEKEARHLPEMISICKTNFGVNFVKAPPFEDMKHGTDLMPVGGGADHLLRIACRVRDYSYIKKWNDDFTIRYDTELPKVIKGWSDYILYSWETPDGKKLYRWFIGRMDVLRREYKKSKVLQNRRPYSNKGGNTRLVYFKWSELGDDFVITRYPQDTSYWEPVNYEYEKKQDMKKFIKRSKKDEEKH